VLRIAGELDLSTVDFLTTVLTAVVHQRPDHLIVDLAEVSFCGARALAAIAEAGLTATTAGTRFGVSAASALIRRCWAQFWANEQPTQYRSTAAALSAAMAHPAHLPAARDTRIDDTALLCTAGDRGAQRSYATL
jgi:anti-anti-sigma factor